MSKIVFTLDGTTLCDQLIVFRLSKDYNIMLIEKGKKYEIFDESITLIVFWSWPKRKKIEYCIIEKIDVVNIDINDFVLKNQDYYNWTSSEEYKKNSIKNKFIKDVVIKHKNKKMDFNITDKN